MLAPVISTIFIVGLSAATDELWVMPLLIAAGAAGAGMGAVIAPWTTRPKR